ncbi:Extracellular sulfatase Sulf-1 [Boothiomyces sp. JEL0866]|nr:Extracellular sulfatase Sulf-1 [Boothiomyces sp. JEL0866]
MFLHVLLSLVSAASIDKKPNIVFFLVDDQDDWTGMEKYMPNFQKLFVKNGTRFDNHFINTPLCCPSRMSILSGKTTHNHNLTDTMPPYGGYTQMRALNLDDEYIPTWMQQQGYNTYFTGKLFVEYTLNYGSKNVPVGWNDFDAAVYPFTFDYDTPVFSKNGAKPQVYPNMYHTDVVANKTLAQIKDALSRNEPFFSYVAPIGCHTGVDIQVPLPAPPAVPMAVYTPPVPAKRHADLYPDLKLPISPNFNETDRTDKPVWIQQLPPLTTANKTFLDHMYRSRVLSLLAIDDMIGEVYETIKAANQLDNTIFVYTADNGYHLGNHGMLQGKETCYEEDIKVPFYASGPGIKKGHTSKAKTSHTDIAPTFAHLAGMTPLPSSIDGAVIPLFGEPEPDVPQRGDFVGIEFWGIKLDEGAAIENLTSYATQTIYFDPHFTYKGVRVCTESKEYCFKYNKLCNGTIELYNLANDPHELNNIYPTNGGNVSSKIVKLQNRLDAYLSVMATCQGLNCLSPIQVLHPNEPHLSFEQVMDSKFDAQYANYEKFRFLSCSRYFDASQEIAFGQPAKVVAPLPDPFVTKRQVVGGNQGVVFDVKAPIESFAEGVDTLGDWEGMDKMAMLLITRSKH